MPGRTAEVQYSAKGTDIRTKKDEDTLKTDGAIREVGDRAFDLEARASIHGKASEKKSLGEKLMERAMELSPQTRRGFLPQTEENDTRGDPNADLDLRATA